MSEQHDNGTVEITVEVRNCSTGAPVAIWHGGNTGLQVYPAGVGGPGLYIQPAAWRALNAAVEAAIPAPELVAVFTPADAAKLAAEAAMHEPVRGDLYAVGGSLNLSGAVADLGDDE